MPETSTRILVSTAEPISSEFLRDVTGGLPRDAEVLVIAPATTHSALRFWVSDVDEAIAHAAAVQEATVERLNDAGVDASGAVGDSDPLQAIEDALATCTFTLCRDVWLFPMSIREISANSSNEQDRKSVV